MTQVGVPLRHRNVCDVRAPHLVGLADVSPFEQIRILPVPVVGHARSPGPTPDRFDPHFLPQPLHMFAIGFDSVILSQFHHQSPTPHAWIDHVNLVQRANNLPIRLALLHGFVIKNRTRYIQQRALLSNAQLGMFCFDQLGTLHRPSCLDFFSRKSTSTVS